MIQLRVAESLRCAYCYELPRGLLEGCEVCGALLHAECRRELGRCSTLGCSGEPAQASELKPEVQIWWPSALAYLQRLLPLSFAAICVAACLTAVGVSASRADRTERMWRAIWEEDARAIREAALLYRGHRGRDPSSVEELLREGWIDDLAPAEQRRYRFVTFEGARWVAIEIEERERVFGTLLLLAPLSSGQTQRSPDRLVRATQR